MRFILIVLILLAGVSFGHHGVASLGNTGIYGPGAPLETSTSWTLPQGKFLYYMKLDSVKFRKQTPSNDGEVESYDLWIFGIGYGVRSWLSAYLFLPYNVKSREDFTAYGFGDLFIVGVLGFKYDEKFKLVPEEENLDEILDWHFTIFGGISLPTGKSEVKDNAGNIDPPIDPAFGSIAYMVGASATKMLNEKLTFYTEISFFKFTENEYSDGSSYKFGDELRVNYSVTYRILTLPSKKFRIDGLWELNYLKIQRDEQNGEKLEASGGEVLYGTVGGRVFFRTMSLGLGYKLPLWKDLNEEELQQGSEGKEKYRLILTLSFIF